MADNTATGHSSLAIFSKYSHCKESDPSLLCPFTYWTVSIKLAKSCWLVLPWSLYPKDKRGEGRGQVWSSTPSSWERMQDPMSGKTNPYIGPQRPSCLWPPVTLCLHLPVCSSHTGLPAIPLISQERPHIMTSDLGCNMLPPESPWLTL